MDLMNKLVEYAQSVYDILYKKKASPHKNEHMTSPTNQGSKNNSNRLFCELITVLTCKYNFIYSTLISPSFDVCS